MKKDNYPAFSVLMSVYKNEIPEYLDEALKSVENQTVKPNEIVLVEDGPISAELKEIILDHQKNFGGDFKIVISKENKGLAMALRLGTKYVSTNWIARMDSDDYSVPNRFEKQLNEIKRNPKLAIVGGQVKEFASNINNVVGKREVPTSLNEIRKFMRWRSPFNHPTVMLNKKVLIRVGGYISFGNLEDYYLWSRIISANYNVINVSETLVYMRADGGMYSRRGKLSNIKYFYKLRKYLRKKEIITFHSQMIGNVIVTLNIMLPNPIRKLFYEKVLHKT